MTKFLMTERTNDWRTYPSRLGAGSGAANQFDDKEVGKFVKLVGESMHNLCAVGDDIEAWIMTVEPYTADAFSMGTVACGGYKEVVFDGLQATPGVGVINVGDYVVCGTVVAKGTALPFNTNARVCSATNQATAKTSPYACRVMSRGEAGTGAVGTKGLIFQINK